MKGGAFRVPALAISCLVFPACDSSTDPDPQTETTEYWSSILYYTPAGGMDQLFLREYSPDGRMTRTYYNSDPARTSPSTMVAWIDSVWYDADDKPEYTRIRRFDFHYGVAIDGESRTLRTAGRVDSVFDTLHIGYRDVQKTTMIFCGVRWSQDGASDSAYCSYTAGSANTVMLNWPRAQRITTRDSVRRTITTREYTPVFTAEGSLVGLDSVLNIDYFQGPDLRYPIVEWSQHLGTLDVDSTVVRYRDGIYRDSAYKYHNGTLRAAGRYDYRKVDIEREVNRIIGEDYIYIP